MVSLLCQYDKSVKHNLKLFHDDHYSNHMFDGYSLSHIYFGIFYGFIFRKWWLVLIIAIIFEVIENSGFVAKRFRQIGYEITYDSVVNIIGDLICNMIGFLIYYYVPFGYKWILLVIFVLNEIIFFAIPRMREYTVVFLIYNFFA